MGVQWLRVFGVMYQPGRGAPSIGGKIAEASLDTVCHIWCMSAM